MRSITRHLGSVALVTAVTVTATDAAAQDTGSIPASGVQGTDTTGDLQLATRRPYWSAGKHRPFISSTLEGGLVYYRPQLAVGYGKPHWRWIGVEAQSQVTIGSGTMYAGLRAALPNADLRLGTRFVYSAGRSYLARAAEYTDETIDFEEEPRARYQTLEAEIAGVLPVGDGAFFGLLGGYHMLGVPPEYDVYDQLLRIVVEPPWIGRVRGGYIHGFQDGIISVGGAVEVLASPERDAYVARVGPQLGVSLTHHLDAALSIMAVVAGPDHLRLDGADIGQFGFRYRWATGDPFPEFP